MFWRQGLIAPPPIMTIQDKIRQVRGDLLKWAWTKPDPIRFRAPSWPIARDAQNRRSRDAELPGNHAGTRAVRRIQGGTNALFELGSQLRSSQHFPLRD